MTPFVLRAGRYPPITTQTPTVDEWTRARAIGLAADYLVTQIDVTVGFRAMWRSFPLYVAAVLAELGGAYLVWLGIREGRGGWFVLAGALVLTGYGLLHAAQPIPHFGRVMAAYGGLFIVFALAWGVAVEGYRPDRYDVLGAALCFAGAAVIAYAPR